MTFHFKADCTFEADDLDAAFLTLAEHFLALAEVEHAVIDGESYTPTTAKFDSGELVLEKKSS